MSVVIKCDLCKTAIEEEMKAFEVKYGYPGSSQPVAALAAHICEDCAKALGVGDFLHKFRSMGAVDLVERAVREAATQRPQITGPDAPVPVDPRFIKRLQGR